jgi:predicted RecA/RadA family phage recombinase
MSARSFVRSGAAGLVAAMMTVAAIDAAMAQSGTIFQATLGELNQNRRTSCGQRRTR